MATSIRFRGAPGMVVAPESEMMVLPEGVIDALGVIVGPRGFTCQPRAAI